MRAVVQRVSRAGVSVEGRTVGEIADGLLVFAGVAETDEPADAEYLGEKIANLRIFERDGRMNDSVVDRAGGVLLISQFTLLADTRKGRRPNFTSAADPKQAVPLLDHLRERLEAAGIVVATGRFGAHMEIEALNDGPVTIVLDSQDRGRPRRQS
ncbi:MAG: D-aminoacyl-tRNA deacylase [Chloroflexota bacterium]|jgi:D-tyrosyl-tRNA(Tyr) deacylase|nr:D-aminoacyl-tRNA deacylase [Chloroflexota bacterium]MDP6509354.1 D-aminoacyl-tRNA deacylase [Chloroflexota bacterium]MDP6756822.1 D-aminoacyl-tRNA deacylase [Chloroflexota bacterium]